MSTTQAHQAAIHAQDTLWEVSSAYDWEVAAFSRALGVSGDGLPGLRAQQRFRGPR